MSLTAPTGATQTLSAGLLTVGLAATVGIALGFEHIGGYIPCMLCLEQRTPYYIGVPLMLLALLASWLKAPPPVTRGLLLVGAAEPDEQRGDHRDEPRAADDHEHGDDPPTHGVVDDLLALARGEPGAGPRAPRLELRGFVAQPRQRERDRRDAHHDGVRDECRRG